MMASFSRVPDTAGLLSRIILSTQFVSRNFNSLNNHQNKNLLKNCIPPNHRLIPNSDRRSIQIWVPDKKGGYKTQKDLSNKQHLIDGFKQLKTEVKLWQAEVKEHFLNDPILICRPGETDVVWTFGKDEDRQKFITTSDSDHNEGNSNCRLEKSAAGYGLFSGTLDSTVPIQGKLKRAGYCNMTSLRPMKSFQRDSYFDWSSYNTLVLRVRGDGRAYMINLSTAGLFDVMWNDIFHFILYTRGGPHWQVARIPFSKFFLSVKGRVQDKQAELPSCKISRFGITTAGCDFMDGQFSLELDYIGVEFDPNHTEEFAYEMYQVPRFIVGN